MLRSTTKRNAKSSDTTELTEVEQTNIYHYTSHNTHCTTYINRGERYYTHLPKYLYTTSSVGLTANRGAIISVTGVNGDP